MQYITEKNYEERMKTVVEPYLAERRECGFDTRVEGQPIYYEHFKVFQPRGVIVISHGFTESVQKFSESIYYMLKAGYEVWGMDHHGHGRSYRLNENPYVVHADRFRDYVLDLVHLTKKRVKPAAKKLPIYLYCHSMGGCIGAWTIEAYPGLFQKAVLSSPMLRLSFGKLPLPVVSAVMAAKGLGNGGKEPVSPVDAFPDERFEDSAATSECRFLYYREKKTYEKRLQTCGASTKWVREAIRACAHVCAKSEMAKVTIPVLLLQAGRDSYVKNASQDLFAAQVKSCELMRFPSLKHELYMSELNAMKPYWEKIFSFLG